MNVRTRKFFSYYRPYLGLLLADLTAAAIVAAITLLFPLLSRAITKDILEANAPDALNQVFILGGVMLGLVVVQAIANAFVDYRGHMMGTLIEADIRNELFAHYQKLSFSFYDEQRTGQLMSRLTNDSFALGELYHHAPEDVILTSLTFTGAFILLANINLSLTLVILAFLPVMAVYAFYFNRRMNRAFARSKERIGDVNAQAEDTLAGIRVVKSFANDAVEQRKFAYENSRFVESRRDGYLNEAYFYNGMMAFTQLLTIAVIVLGAVAILTTPLDLADLITFLLCVGILIDPIRKALNFARLYQEGITGFNRLMEVLEIVPDIQDAPNAIEITKARGDIEFRNVSFGYKQDQQYILNDLNLHIRAGEYVALVGASGVGKTTLCSLIPRFYDINEGEIRLDGTDIRHVQLDSLRRNIGVVQQDIYLFAGTVAENIRYGKLDATMDEVIEAARKANAHDFIMALPNGYDTDIGQRGVKLSGGQKQRLSIARVFLKDPPIIIFDEATSALDNESERAVQQSMERLSDNRTTIVIAHRLSTIRNAERIIVLSEGGIDEQGTHDELIARGSTYANLHNLQFA